MDLEKIREERTSIVEKLEAYSKVMVEESRDLTDEEKSEWDKLEARADEIDSILEKVNKQEQRSQAGQKLERPAAKIEVIRNERHDEDGEYRGYSSLGELLQDVRKAERGSHTEKLKELRAATGMGGDTGADGGFAVQSDFAEMLMDRVIEE